MEVECNSAEKEKKKKDEEERSRGWKVALEGEDIPRAVMRRHIVSYLVHNCYGATAAALSDGDGRDGGDEEGGEVGEAGGDGEAEGDGEGENKEKDKNKEDKQQLKGRLNMMKALHDGDVLRAISLGDALLPGEMRLRDAFPLLHARLLCQHFAELVRARQALQALRFAQSEVAPVARQVPLARPLLASYMQLLAYAHPERSAVFQLVDQRRRVALADEVNGRVVVHLVGASHGPASDLERLLRQLVVVMRRLHPDCPNWRLPDAFADDHSDHPPHCS